jgi:hypothetical protein
MIPSLKSIYLHVQTQLEAFLKEIDPLQLTEPVKLLQNSVLLVVFELHGFDDISHQRDFDLYGIYLEILVNLFLVEPLHERL